MKKGVFASLSTRVGRSILKAVVAGTVVAVATVSTVSAVTTVTTVTTATKAFVVGALTLSVTGSEVDFQLSATKVGGGQLLLGSVSGSNVGEIDMGKATGPAGGAVDSDTDVGDVREASEEVVELGVGGLVGDVTDEKLIGGGIRRPVLFAGTGSLLLVSAGNAGYPASMPERAVDSGARSADGGGVLEGDKAISSAHTPGVAGNVGVLNLAICLEGLLQMLLVDLKHNVAHKDGSRLCYTLSAWCSYDIACAGCRLTVELPPGLAFFLGLLCDVLLGLMCLLGDVLRQWVLRSGLLGIPPHSLHRDSSGNRGGSDDGEREGSRGGFDRNGSGGREGRSHSGAAKGLPSARQQVNIWRTEMVSSFVGFTYIMRMGRVA